jgi:hypothetical protein
MFNKKGQGFIWIRVIFIAIFFLIMFALALAPFMTTVLGSQDLSVLGGLGEFVAGNLAVFVFVTFLLVLLIALIYGFSSE